ncbi:MAG: arsenate reductase ArsC, partial [Bacillota bacterium]
FVCTHNSCRSQMAEAVAKLDHSDFFAPHSAGTTIKKNINPDAVALIKKVYDYDMEQTQFNKTLDALPSTIDVLVTMGCNVECPYVPCKHREDWNLDDPTGKGEEAFKETLNLIQSKMNHLRKRIESKELSL